MAFRRTLGSDDMPASNTIQQAIAQLDGLNSAGIVGTSLTLSNAIGICAVRVPTKLH